MKRRDFLKTGVKVGIAANALPLLLNGSPLKALGRSPLRRALEASGTSNNKVLVIIQLQGGNDGLNCVIPVSDPLYKTLRPSVVIDTTTALTLTDHSTLGFHPSMTGISTLYEAQKVALIQNVGYANSSLSHFRGTDIWNTATDPSLYATTGWVGRLLLEQNPGYPPATIPTDGLPLAIQFGNALSNLFLAQTGGMGIALGRVPTASNPSSHNYDPIPSNPTTQYQELEYVRLIQSETEIYSTNIAKRSVQTNKVTYPGSALATSLASIAQMIASGFTTKIYMVSQGSYDTHSNQLATQNTLLGDLAAAVLAFQQDIEALGVADQVAMMAYSEFGRRPQENGSGTDHGTAAPLFVMGTQVKGMVYGSDPQLDTAHLTAGNLTFDPQHDFRNVYATVMNEWLLEGGDQTQVTKDIQSVLTTDANGTYSANSTWQSLGLFKSQLQGYVPSNPDATGLMLMQNYPNPSYATTTIEFALPATGPVQLGVFNTSGVEVARIADGNMGQGIHRESFDASKLPSGAYIYRLKTGVGEVARQMIIAH